MSVFRKEIEKDISEMISGRQLIRREYRRPGQSEYFYLTKNADGSHNQIDVPDDFGRQWIGKTLPDNFGNGYQPAGTNVGNMSNNTSDYKAQAYKLGTLSGKEEDKQYNNYDPLYKNLSGFDDDKVINYNNERPFVERDNNENILINECSQSPRFVRYMKRLKQPDREGIGYNGNLKTIDQPTHTGISLNLYNQIKKQNSDIQKLYPENLKDLSQEQIDNLYCQFIYKPKHIELIDNNRLAEAVFDTSVLSDATGIKILQKTMNEFGIPTKVDGIIGSKTINSLNSLQDVNAFIERFKQNRNKNFNNPRFNKTHIRRTNSY